MNTRSEIETELSNRLQIANNSTTFPTSRITTLVQDASLWAGTLFFWPSLYRSRIFSSKPNTQTLAYDYYDYPSDFLTGSISRLYINGVKYDRKNFQDFLDYVDNVIQGSLAPDPTKECFAEFGRQFFVYPTVTSAGTNDGLVWGNIQPLALSTASSTTIFSNWDDSGNEAILKKAISVAMERLDPVFANQQKAEAIQLLTLIWRKVVVQFQKDQRLQHPSFNTIDYFGATSGQAVIGNFSNPSVIF